MLLRTNHCDELIRKRIIEEPARMPRDQPPFRIITRMRKCLQKSSQRFVVHGKSILRCALRGARRRSNPAKTDVTTSTGPLLAWFTSQPGDVCDASDGQSGPTGLMARAEPLAAFAVKIFVKEHKVAPVRVVGEARVAAVARATPAGVGEKDAGESRAKFKGDLTEVHHAPRSGGAFDLEAVSIEMVVAFEGLEDEEVYRKPDRPTPVRVAAEEASSGFGGLIVDAVLDSTSVNDIRIILVKLRNRA